MGKPRLIAYMRVSTSSQSVKTQEFALTDKGYTWDEAFIDEGVSGTIKAFDRPEFKRLFDSLEEGDTLLVYHLNRLGRNTADILNTVDKLKDLGVNLIVANLNINTNTIEGKILLSIMATLAEADRDDIIERTGNGRERAMSNGVKFGRKNKTTPEMAVEVLEKLNNDKKAACEMLTISLATLNRYLKDARLGNTVSKPRLTRINCVKTRVKKDVLIAALERHNNVMAHAAKELSLTVYKVKETLKYFGLKVEKGALVEWC